MEAVEAHKDGTVVHIRLQTRASRAEIAGAANGRLRVRVPAPPVEGAANEAAAKFLAEALGTAKSSVRLLRGHKSREKDFLVEGVDLQRAKGALLSECV